MSTPIRLTLPYPPSANVYWRHARGRTYISPEALQYRKDVAALGLGMKPLAGLIRIDVRVFRPIRSGDLMNREKVLSDSLQGVAFVDDSQIVEAHFYRHDDKQNPRVEVEITPLPDPEPATSTTRKTAPAGRGKVKTER